MVFVAVFIESVVVRAATSCPVSSASPSQWREAMTHSEKNKISKSELCTTSARERKIWQIFKTMEKEILRESTPALDLVLSPSVQSSDVISSPGWGSGIIHRYEISGLGSSGDLSGTLLLPVSGHMGVSNARGWAANDTYEIRLARTGTPKVLVGPKKSLGLITFQEFKIRMNKNEVVRLFYERSGSGSAGFPEGRIVEFTWNGK